MSEHANAETSLKLSEEISADLLGGVDLQIAHCPRNPAACLPK